MKVEDALEAGNKKDVNGIALGRLSGFGTDLQVKLKAGQSISVYATVTGKNRKVGLALLDPTGKIIAVTKLFDTTAPLKFEEASAAGTYTVVVVSDAIGKFSIRATASPEEELDAKKLEEIKELKALLAKKEADLKALKAKKK